MMLQRGTMGGEARRRRAGSSTSQDLSEREKAQKLSKLTGNIHHDLKRALQRKMLAKRFKGEIIEMLIYLAFLTVFSIVVLGSRDRLYSFQYNEFMKDLFLAEEFPEPEIYKTFYDIATFEEFWEYMNDVLVPGLFTDTGGMGAGYIYGQNIIVGTVRLRQIRVKRAACTPVDTFLPVFSREQCFARYKGDRVSEEAFGPGGRFRYYSSSALDNVRQPARLQVFEGGGFIEDFPPSVAEPVHAAHMRDLQNVSWVDLQTRAVFIDFATYNANVNLVHIAQMTLEFLPSGGVFPSSTFRVVRLYKYENSFEGQMQFILEMILIIFVLSYLVQELWEIYFQGCWQYWMDVWNILDWINLLLFVSAFLIRIVFVVETANMDIDPRQTERYFNFQKISLLNSSEHNVLATNAFILWVKVYKYCQFFPPMKAVTDTIGLSVKNTAGFLTVVAFVLFGFAQAGVLAFGSDIEEFRSFIDTFYTLLRLLLGDFDFLSMQYSNRTFGPIYFLAFLIIVFFVMLSMFLAILNDSYLQVQAERKKEAAENLDVVTVFKSWVKHRTKFLTKRKDQISALQEGLARGDLDGDELLDIEEVRVVFERHEDQARQLLGVESAEELLARFDVDGDMFLDLEEQGRLLKALTQWKNNIALEYDEVRQLEENLDEAAAGQNHHIALFMASVKKDLALFQKLMIQTEAKLAATAEAVGVDGDDRW